jgi:hypothetical protein
MLGEFGWSVSKNGYQWAKPTGHTADRFLCDVVPRVEGNFYFKDAYSYYPLQNHKGLFRKFANIKPAAGKSIRDAIKEFADEHGLLGLQAQFTGQKPGLDEMASLGESQKHWEAEITSMRQVVELWDAVEQRDGKVLSQIVWDDNLEVVRYLGTMFSREIYPEVWANRNDPITPAWMFIRRMVSLRLKIYTHTDAVPSDGLRGASLRIFPHNLIGALWLQLSHGLSGNLHYAQCPACKEWFELSPGTGRSDKEFCSIKCRQKAYRGRKERALELHLQGKTIKEVAAECETAQKTAEGWLAKGLFAKGLTVDAIAKKLRLSVALVKKLIANTKGKTDGAA